GVGGLARRHVLYVDLVATEGGGITGRVVSPPALFTRLNEPEPVVVPPPPVAPPAEPVTPGTQSWQRLPVPVMPSFSIPPAAPLEGFSWFDPMTRSRRPVRNPIAPTPPAPAVANTASEIVYDPA